MEGQAERAVRGVETLELSIPDQQTGESYSITFERVSQAQSADGRNVYVYVPQGWQEPIGKLGLDERVDPNPHDEWHVCADWPDEYVQPLTQAGMDSMAETMAQRVLPINEDCFGPVPPADPGDPASTAIVIFVYEVLSSAYYDCTQPGVAGQYDLALSQQAGMHAFVVDATWPRGMDDVRYIDWLLAHELQHLQTELIAPEEAWINEGLSRMIEFLGFDVPFEPTSYAWSHRTTSLVNWEYKMESYSASMTFMGYLWARAGGDRGVDINASDGVYQNEAGDLLIRLIHQNPLSGVTGVSDSIRQWNEQTGGDLPTDVRQLYLDMVLALALDVAETQILDLPGDWVEGAVRTSLEANELGIHTGPWSEERWLTAASVVPQTVLQYQTNYEYFSKVGDRFRLTASVLGAEATDPDGDGLLWISRTEANETATLTSTTGDLGHPGGHHRRRNAGNRFDQRQRAAEDLPTRPQRSQG